MLKLIRADLYKSFHRAYLFVFMIVLSGMAIFLNASMAYMHVPLESGIGIAAALLMYPLFLISMFADIVTAEENKEHTMKNTISFGVTRSQLFLSKIISTVLVAVSVAMVTVIVYLGSAFALLRPQKGDITGLLTDLGLRVGTALLIYVAAVVLATLLAMAIKRNAMFTFSYFGILLVPVILFKVLNLLNPVFGSLQRGMLYMQSQIIASVPQAQLMNTVWISIGHIAVFLTVGMLLLRRQEVN